MSEWKPKTLQTILFISMSTWSFSFSHISFSSTRNWRDPRWSVYFLYISFSPLNGYIILRKTKMANTLKRSFPASQKTVKFSNHWTRILKHRGKSLDKICRYKLSWDKHQNIYAMNEANKMWYRFTCIYISLYNKTMYSV